MERSIWFLIGSILLVSKEWGALTVVSLQIDCSECPEERKVMDEEGFLSWQGCEQVKVLQMHKNCEVCATTIGASEVIIKAKDKDNNNTEVSVTLKEGWIHSRGCAPPSAKPGSCEYKNDVFVCYCNEPGCNMKPPPCAWLREANNRIPDPKGCMDVVDGQSVYTMEYTMHVETSETTTFIEEKVEHHRGAKKKQYAATTTESGSGCGRHGSNRKQCRANGCEFSVVKEVCQESRPCSGLEGIRYCPREGVFYLDGGVICRSTAQDGDGCPPLEVVVATKVLLKEGQTKADLRGVVYSHEIIHEDPLSTRTADDQSSSKCDLDLQNRYSEMSLYLPAIYGNPDRKGSGGCLTYSIPVLTDGDYEFSMKFMEYLYTDGKTKRGFFINLETLDSSTDLVYDLDVFHYVGSCAPFELIVNMKVFSGKILLQGFPEMRYKYRNDKLSLSFCYGEDAPDPAYILSAFYVAKLGADCTTYGKDKVACKKAQCEFNLYKENCENRKKCNFDDSVTAQARKGSFYSNGGSLCFNEKQENDGPSIHVINATKVLLEKGQSATDSRGVFYHSDNYEDPHDTRDVDWTSLKKCNLDTILPAEDRDVYYPSIYGRTAKRETNGCIYYPLPPFESDGNYEISLKFLEFFYSDSKSVRGFSVRLRNFAGKELEILYELNVFSYAGYCNPLEILVLMKLSGSTLTVQGLPDFDIGEGKEIKLGFCYGDDASKENDPNYLMSAFYLAKLIPDCSTHKHIYPCRQAGCQANTAKNTCENRKSCHSKPLGDRLWGNAYYVDGGTLCYSKNSKGFILYTQMITAQKMGLENGSTVTDSRGFVYGPERTPEDPHKLRKISRNILAKCDKVNLPLTEDRAIHDTVLAGSRWMLATGTCLSYNIPQLTSNGDYEIALRMIEPEYNEPYFKSIYHDSEPKREWTVRLDCGEQSLQLLYEHNIFSYVGRCRPMDVVALFKLSQGMLTVQGFQPMPYRPGDKLQIALCYGHGNFLTKEHDVTFILSAFHVAKYADSCPSFGKNLVDCRKNGCEVNTVTMGCETKRMICDERLNLGGSLRANVYFAVGGVICYNEKQRGPLLNPRKVVAVNLGVDGNDAFIDERGIVYHGEQRFSDNLNSRQTRISNCGFAKVFPITDREFYRKYIEGKDDISNQRKGGCVEYDIPPLQDDGDYELSMKFWEDRLTPNPQTRGTRVFLKVGVEELQLLYDFNVYYYVGKCKQMEVVVPMQLNDGTLTVMGFPNFIKLNRQQGMRLAFCYGETAKNPNFLVSAFHVSRLTPNCATYADNKFKCRLNNCEYNIAKGICQNRKPCDEDGRLGERLRGDAFYVDGGVVCYNPEGRGAFHLPVHVLSKKMERKKMGEKEYLVDSRSSFYDAEGFYLDEHKTRLYDGNGDRCGNRSFKRASEKDIYFPAITSDPLKRDTKGCLTYPIPLRFGAGNYELLMKFIEYVYKDANQSRAFHVKLQSGQGKVHLLYNFNVYSYVGGCNPMEVFVQIRVTDDTIVVQGFPPIPNDPKSEIALSFCYGDGFFDPNYLISAFSMTRLLKDCKEAVGDLVSCRYCGCEWHIFKSTCHERKPCRNTEKCMRAKSHYLDAGVLCYNEESEGDCPIEKVYAAIKSGLKKGEQVTDSRGVVHGPEKDFKDPHKLREHVSDKQINCEDSPYTKLYGPHIIGNDESYDELEPTDGCTTYNVANLDSDGEYELVFRVMEFEMKFGSNLRGFDLRLATGGKSIELSKDIDVEGITGSKCKPLDIVVLLSQKKGKLTAKGHPPMKHKKGDKLKVMYCFGSEDAGDNSYLFGSFYVAKLAI